MKSRVSRARRALQVILEQGAYRRDGGSASDAMRSILADAERLSAGIDFSEDADEDAAEGEGAGSEHLSTGAHR